MGAQRRRRTRRQRVAERNESVTALFFLGVHLANPFTAPALLGGGFIENYEKAI